MTKVLKFLSTVRGCEDGIHVKEYKKGETHEVGESLAIQFFHMGAVEEVKKPKTNSKPKKDDKGKEPVQEDNADEPVEENKAKDETAKETK